MKPISEFINQIIQDKCENILPQIPNEAVNMILTDFPYGVANEVKITRSRNPMKFKYQGGDISQNFGDWDKFPDLNSYLEFVYPIIDELIRILKPGGMFISWFDKDKINLVSHYLQAQNFKCKGYCAQIKSNPVPQARKVKWQNGWEEIGLWQKLGGELTYNYKEGQHPDYFIVPVVGGKERTSHPTQKPLYVIKDLLKWWSNEEDLILDPFAGSGTTAVGCIELKRNYVMIEELEKYVSIINHRVQTKNRGVF